MQYYDIVLGAGLTVYTLQKYPGDIRALLI
jgi:hypothetical protein